MKKILFVCDTDNFPSGAFKFIQSIHLRDKFLLTGAFFHSELVAEPAVVEDCFANESVPANKTADIKSVKESIRLFVHKCKRASIHFSVHEESSHFTIEDVVKESRFADLIVMSEELFFSDIIVSQPNKYMQQVLQRSECPVIIIPESYTSFKSIVAAYDGKRESMFALKQFCNLFPQFTLLPSTIIHWQKSGLCPGVPDRRYLEEYATRHFSILHIENKQFKDIQSFNEWLCSTPDTLLIAGSFSNHGSINSMHESFIEKTIQQHKVPIFIAHPI